MKMTYNVDVTDIQDNTRDMWVAVAFTSPSHRPALTRLARFLTWIAARFDRDSTYDVRVLSPVERQNESERT